MADILTTELIQSALELASVTDPEEIIDQQYLKKGYELFGDVIAYLSILGSTIPYMSNLNIPLEQGKKTYTVGLSDEFDVNDNAVVQVVTGNVVDQSGNVTLLDTVDVYQNNRQSLDSYSSAPYSLYYEFDNDYTTFEFYPIPNEGLTARLKVKKRLQKTTLFQRMYTITEEDSILLKYCLASFCADNWGTVLPQNVQARYNDLLNKIKNKSRTPLKTKSDGTITSYNRNCGVLIV